MLKLGHIEIRDKVIFVPDKICKNCIYWNGHFDKHKFARCNYILLTKNATSTCKAWKQKYQTSKQEVEVKNVFWSTQFNKWIIELIRSQGITSVFAEHNQPCEVEVKNGIATIVKIL